MERCFPFTVLVYVVKGSYYVEIHRKVYRLGQGQAIAVPESILHNIWMDEAGILHWAHISYHWLGRDVLSFYRNPVLFDAEPAAGIGEFCRKLASTDDVKDFRLKMEQVLERNVLMLQLLKLIRENAVPCEEAFDPGNIKLFDVLTYIHRNLDKSIRLKQLADIAGLSEFSLITGFKKQMNIAPIEFVIQEKMKYASRRLSAGNATVSEVAYALGYNDPLYFSKLFKKHFGISPRNYRSALHKQTP
jgi:AraC-like DNA-binding protein